MLGGLSHVFQRGTTEASLEENFFIRSRQELLRTTRRMVQATAFFGLADFGAPSTLKVHLRPFPCPLFKTPYVRSTPVFSGDFVDLAL